MRWSLKTRLAVWHAAAVLLVLLAAGGAMDRLLIGVLQRQLDGALLSLAETEAASSLDSPEGRVHLHATEPVDSLGLRRLDRIVQLVDADGQVLDQRPSLGGDRLPAAPALLARLGGGETMIETAPDVRGEPVRVVSLPIEVDGAFRYAIQVGAPLAPLESFVATVRLLLAGAGATVLAAVLLTGHVLAHRALRPVEDLVAAARHIRRADPGRRLPHPGVDDEIGRLADTLNAMLDRIEASFEVQRRFTADAAHELRSPLSRLRAELEIALRRARTAADYEAVLRSSLEEVERLSALAEDLLALARIESGEPTSPAVAVPVDDVVAGLARRVKAEAERGGVDLVIRVPPGLAVAVSASDLVIVAGNLLDNALRFTPRGGRVTVDARREGDAAVLTVSDTGPGIPAEDLPRVFERFFRGAARSPDAPGVGLGLAICRALAERHGGTVTAESPATGGARFQVRLPAA
jgi:two-component system OmpR family sensor kinase